jgi:oligoendopeptidase F
MTKRKYVPAELNLQEWGDISPLYEELTNRKINSAAELESWMLDVSELEAVISENAAWRYIRMTCDTQNESLSESYNFFVSEIQPHIAPFADKLNRKLVDSPFFMELDQDKYFTYFRSIKKSIELYQEKNIPLFAKLNQAEQRYGAIAAAQTLEYNGEEMTLQKAGTFLKDKDRKVREEIYHKINARRAQDEEELQELYTELIQMRQQIAVNAGFKNYRDYKFEELNRFDYNVDDCIRFHDAVKNHIVPLVKIFDEERKNILNYDAYRPWDSEVDVSGNEPLKPFTNGEDLLKKTIACFNAIDPYFAQCIQTMGEMKHLDLESRKGKAPGGYNYPLYETGVPFIFMNAVGLHRDMVTMVHEGGHAVHSFLTRDFALTEFKSTPSEVAELASMSMELISMDGWSNFFTDPQQLIRAKKEQLEKALRAIPWICSIDKFQHWVYENPNHPAEERNEMWFKINREFSTGVTDIQGLEANVRRGWQVQLHLFEVPFYYIEYGFAQLGAIAMWKNYCSDKKKGIDNYKNALRLGYSKTIPQIYKCGGISFDFSEAYIQDLSLFVQKEIKALS